MNIHHQTSGFKPTSHLLIELHECGKQMLYNEVVKYDPLYSRAETAKMCQLLD